MKRIVALSIVVLALAGVADLAEHPARASTTMDRATMRFMVAHWGVRVER